MPTLSTPIGPVSTVEESTPDGGPVKKRPAKKRSRASNGKVKYPKIFAELRISGEPKGPLSVDDAKEILGWTEEPEDEDWGDKFDLKDLYKRKIRLLNNPSNRPFKPSISKRYISDMLRKCWYNNGESYVIGRSGEVRDGQHRLVSFVLAEQERKLNQKKWGKSPLKLDALIGYGYSDDQKTADSFDKGQGRKLDDVIFRHEKFPKSMGPKEQAKLARIISGAIRLVWIRAGGQRVSDAPHFPHSEALEFYSKHPGILKSAKKIVELDHGEGNEKLLSSKLSLAYAAALHYLTESVDPEASASFWEGLATGEGLTKGSPILALSNYLSKSTAGSGKQRDDIVGAVVKSWVAFVAGESVTAKDIQVKKKNQTKGNKTIRVPAEHPRIGGIDAEVEERHELTTPELIILNSLSNGKEKTYRELSQSCNLTMAVISKLCFSDKEESLASRTLVRVSQYEPEDGQTASPYQVQITKKGLSQIK